MHRTHRDRAQELWTEVIASLTLKDLENGTVAQDYCTSEFVFLLGLLDQEYSVGHVFISDDDKIRWTAAGWSLNIVSEG